MCLSLVEGRAGVATRRGRYLVSALSVRLGRLRQAVSASAARVCLQFEEGYRPSAVFVVPLRLGLRDRPDQAAVVVVFVSGGSKRLSSKEPAAGDTPSSRRFEFGSVDARIAEALSEKGMLT